MSITIIKRTAQMREFLVEPYQGQLTRLMCNVSKDSRPVTPKTLHAFSRSGNLLAIARDDDRNIFGCATLVLSYKLNGSDPRMEHVSVDPAYAGKGIGRQLSIALIDEARRRGLRRIELTSEPSRVAANKLYESLGFKKRNTNVWRLTL